MKTRLLPYALGLLLAGAAPALACDTCPCSEDAAARQDIVDTALAAGSFKTLATALKHADLVGALKGEGPFTVFAPTDEAFAKLPEGTLQSLLKPENLPKLKAILTYHVVSGSLVAEQVVKRTSLTTLNGQRVDLQVTRGEVHVDGATVVKADVMASNGVIHVIDEVILPSSEDLAQTAIKAGSFKTLVAAAKAAGLVPALTGDRPLTVFAPTDEAFAKLPEGTVETLLKPENKAKLAGILKYHVVAGRVYSDQALEARHAKTLQGESLEVTFEGGVARVSGAKLLKTDIEASNGVIHVIDSVLLPPTKSSQASDCPASRLIRAAIKRGAELYNAGSPEGCAAVYEVALQSMADLGRAYLPGSSRERILHLLGDLPADADRKAWALRRALDGLYGKIQRAPADVHESAK